MNEEIRHLLRMELRHLQCRLSASALGEVIDLLEQAWGRGREAAYRSELVLRVGVEAVREDLLALAASLRGVRRPFTSRRHRAGS